MRLLSAVFILGFIMVMPRGASAAPTDAHYALSLVGLLPADKPLQVYLDVRQGVVQRGFALSPDYNRAVHLVDITGLKVTGDKLAGTLSVTVQPDTYVPKDGKAVAAKLTLDADASEGKLAGTWSGACGDVPRKGTLTGTLAAPPADHALRHFSVELEAAALMPGDKGQGKRVRVSFSTRDGKAFGVKYWPPGSIVDTSFSARVESTDLACTDGKLAGHFTVAIIPQGQDKPLTYTYTVKGDLIAGMAAGTWEGTRDREVLPGSTFAGKVTSAPAPAPADALYTLLLQGATEGHTYVQVYLAARGGKFTQAFAATPDWNNATHDVDAAGLTLTGNTVKGTLKLTVQPDPWLPKDHQPVAATYTLDGQINHYEVVGTHEGTFGALVVKGQLDGELIPPPAARPPVHATLKIENGLSGGNPWQNRAFLGIDLDHGKVIGGSLSNNHTKLAGTVDSGTVTWDPDGFSADVEITVAPGGNVDAGQYTVKAKGALVGDLAAGEFQTYRDGKLTKAGRFWAAAQEKAK